MELFYATVRVDETRLRMYEEEFQLRNLLSSTIVVKCQRPMIQKFVKETLCYSFGSTSQCSSPNHLSVVIGSAISNGDCLIVQSYIKPLVATTTTSTL